VISQLAEPRSQRVSPDWRRLFHPLAGRGDLSLVLLPIIRPTLTYISLCHFYWCRISR
jgi:hypothetical protein